MFFKGVIHPKMEILSFIYPNVNFLLWNIKKLFLGMFFMHKMKVNGVQN